MKIIVTTSALLSCCLLSACGSSQSTPAAPPAAEPAVTEPATVAAPSEPEAPAVTPAPAAPAPEPKTMIISLQPRSKSKLSGQATLAETADGVRVMLQLEGVSPGEHGAHVHEKGDCSAEDAASAGGHFNPGSHDHGLPDKAHRHLGDLGNISIGKDGKGAHEISISGANLKDNDPNSFLGRAIIIHEKKDDGGQPTGNAGGRIGCGEIK